MATAYFQSRCSVKTIVQYIQLTWYCECGSFPLMVEAELFIIMKHPNVLYIKNNIGIRFYTR